MGPTLALCWPRLALSCPYVGPMFAYVGLRETFGALSVPSNANPHSSDWEGLGKGWGSAAGAAALITFGYYRRPPARTRASGRRPDLRATPMPPTPHPTRGWCQRWRAGEVVKVAWGVKNEALKQCRPTLLSPPLQRPADNCETADSATATTIDTA